MKLSLNYKSQRLRKAVALRTMIFGGLLAGWAAALGAQTKPSPSRDNPVQRLAQEVRQQGWIVYAGKSPKGDWDLFLCRPDGSEARNLTQTPAYNEYLALFSRDGRRMLYRRIPRSQRIDNTQHGDQGELVLANSDGAHPVALGKAGEYTWASWSPDGRQIASLSIKGIAFFDLASRKIVRALPRRGFFQQMTWSPDGQWLSGVANSFGVSWSIARMSVSTGEAFAVNRVDCCTPDWFPDSQNVIFSWRPPGQKINNGYGWTQLWRADAQGKTRQLVYGEDGRHIYGGHVSPDGKYVLFTGNMQENGDPGNAGAPMALMRLSDAPIIGGASKELRAKHPKAKDGPVLTLPAGWEPCWTASELPAGKGSARALVPVPIPVPAPEPTGSSASETSGGIGAGQLAGELHSRGWIAYSAKTERGDWDLFLCRPDGSDVRNLTQTPEYNDFSGLFSGDGRRMLYRRIPRGEKIDNNNHGAQGELMLANCDGGCPEALGKAGEYPWASWSPDGRQFASLSIKGISLIDLESRKVARKLERKGFFQQMTWSPDGQWLCGVANLFGASWSIARMSVSTGEAAAVNRVDCCTPDWFPDSQNVIFSWRPPGQKINKGYGWTQLWRADAEGKTRQLVYGEDGRHVYGGHVSPDGKYVLFTGNMQEDGDPGNAGAPMALMRLNDAPIIKGVSQELRAQHPEAKDGPVLTLPTGWEPCWTSSELPAGKGAAPAPIPAPAPTPTPTGASASEISGGIGAGQLTGELRSRGWIAYSAKTERGDWDLFLTRPDGSDRRNLCDTQNFSEAGVRFSPDGKRLFYYRMPKTESVDNNTYGTFDLIIADADGSQPVAWGKDYPWASWGPDSSQIACLTMKGIQVIDLATRRMVRQWPRQGIVSQLVWSPDGKAFTGTANGLGPYWNIGRLDAATGAIVAVSETDRYNCTSDWRLDSQQILYARGIIPQAGGRAELWAAAADGKSRRMLFAEAGRHIYGSCSSPDGQYVLFTRSAEDLGKVDNSRTTMAIVRWSDTPMLGDGDDALRKRFPGAGSGPWLDLGPGWEPHWTYADIAQPNKGPSK
ncbi:MAG: hypothetical protein NTX50_00505 [Candidatus Sumerlaeota bacterium]|nr:hypothetical protein [Candidatus Sumerlaeota bacterium]